MTGWGKKSRGMGEKSPVAFFYGSNFYDAPGLNREAAVDGFGPRPGPKSGPGRRGQKRL